MRKRLLRSLVSFQLGVNVIGLPVYLEIQRYSIEIHGKGYFKNKERLKHHLV